MLNTLPVFGRTSPPRIRAALSAAVAALKIVHAYFCIGTLKRGSTEYQNQVLDELSIEALKVFDA
jgi:hypothetical protein